MKTIIQDNFFDNPDTIRNFALSLDYSPRKPNQFFEGVRSKPLHLLDKNLYNDICSKIIKIYYDYKNYEFEASVFFHKTREQDKKDTQWTNDKIHKDKAITAGIIYLTPNAPVNCGTQTYTKVKNQFVPDIIMGNKYNRLIIYNAQEYHSASNFFGENNQSRMCVLFFLEKIKKL